MYKGVPDFPLLADYSYGIVADLHSIPRTLYSLFVNCAIPNSFFYTLLFICQAGKGIEIVGQTV